MFQRLKICLNCLTRTTLVAFHMMNLLKLFVVWDRTPKGTFSVLKMIATYFDIGTFNIILSTLSDFVVPNLSQFLIFRPVHVDKSCTAIPANTVQL
jgi:hypothetical protein